LFLSSACTPGLPDFPWYNIPKWDNYNKRLQKHTRLAEHIHSYNRSLQSIPNGHEIYLNFPFQGLPKYSEIGLFWYEKMSSGNIFGCQMVYLQTKNPNLGKFWRALEGEMLIYFKAIWNI
jgi:hypothetical protein